MSARSDPSRRPEPTGLTGDAGASAHGDGVDARRYGEAERKYSARAAPLLRSAARCPYVSRPRRREEDLRMRSLSSGGRSVCRARLLCSTALAVALSAVAIPVRADEPDTGLAFVTGASVFLAGFVAGGTLIAGNAGRGADTAGWLTMQASFAVAPLAAHGVVGEWGRGLVFAAAPTAAAGGNAVLFATDPNAVRHSVLSEQRVLWSLFGFGLFSGLVGIVDATFADRRAKALVIAPSVGAGRVGLEVGGVL